MHRPRRWYEGGGLVRHQYLIKTAPLHAKLDGVWAYSNVTAVNPTATEVPSLGSTGDAVLHCETTLENEAASAATGSISVTVFDASGKIVATAKSSASSVPPNGGRTIVNARMPITGAELWSVARPYLYTLQVKVLSATGTVVDTVNVTSGIRTVEFDADKGLLVSRF